MLNVNTNSWPTPDVFRPRNSRLVVKPLSKLSFSVRHDPQRSFLRNSLDRMRSLHDPAHTPSPYDFQTVFVLYTRYSTSQCWSQPFRTLFPIESSLLHLWSWSTTNRNSRSPRYWTPRLTTVNVPANYCTLSVGQATKAQMKKPCGYSLPNSDTLPNLLRNSTPSTPPSLALCQNSPDSGFLMFTFFYVQANPIFSYSTQSHVFILQLSLRLIFFFHLLFHFQLLF